MLPSGRASVVGGPGVDEVQHGARGLGRDEAQHVLQHRVDHGVDPVMLEGIPVVLAPPHFDVLQARLDAISEVRDQARRAAMRAIAGRLLPVLGILQQAAQTEPELAALWREIAERRAVNMRRFVADLAATAPLRLDLDEAADIVWATNAPELYQLLTSQRGWSPDRYERFLADTWRRLLIAG
jgi:hypothetical protein